MTGEVRRRLTTKVIVVRGGERGKQKNTGDSIMGQKVVLLRDTIRHDWDQKEGGRREETMRGVDGPCRG